MSTLRLTAADYAVIRAHGELTYPHECCGALLGHSMQDGSWRIVAIVRAENTRTDSAHNRYEIAPGELVRIQREAMRDGFDIAGFYHSHPDHAAQWSAADFAEAHWIGCAYVITEVRAGNATATNAFLLAGSLEEDKRFEPMTLEMYEPDESPQRDISWGPPVSKSAPNLVP